MKPAGTRGDVGVAAAQPFDENPLGSAPVPRLLLQYAPPAILSMMVSALYNIIDTFFVGHGVGQEGIAATTVAFPLMMLMSAFGAWFGAGGNALAALKLGEGKTQEAENCLGNALSMLIVIPGAMSLLALAFLDPIIDILGATDANRDLSREFCFIILAGFVIQAVGVGLANFVRTDGSPRYALVVSATGAVVSIVLNWLFVLVLNMKMTGSALATVAGQGVTTLMVLQYFLSSKSRMTLRPAFMVPRAKLVRGIAAVGLSTFAVQVAGSLTSTMLNMQITALGPTDPIGADGGLAVIGTVNKVIQLMFFVILGFSVAVQPILGYNFGARRYQRVRSAFWITVAASMIVNLVLWIICHAFIGPIMGFFNLDESLHAFAAQTFIFMTFMFPVVPFQVVGSNYFQATGQPLKATTLTLTRQLIFYLPCLFLVPYPMAELTGLSALACLPMAAAFADAFAILVTGFFVVKEMMRLKELGERQSGDGPAKAAEFDAKDAQAQEGSALEGRAVQAETEPTPRAERAVQASAEPAAQTSSTQAPLSAKVPAHTRPDTGDSAFLRAENEDDDGYDPYSDRPASPEPLWERDPWN